MINRIFKNILVFSICIGISLPTNAAVSVSDGSAFLTKAEFDADLNNLSNRMAQLENSLDAKIDSLVSSYLTRNGIWNGAKQTLEFNLFADFWTVFTDGAGVPYDFKSKIQTEKTLTYGVKCTINYKSKELISSITKTGMLYAYWDVYTGYDFAVKMDPDNAKGTDKRNITFFYNTSDNANVPTVTNDCESSLWINGNCVFNKSSVEIDARRSMDLSNGAKSLNFIPLAGRVNFMFFVSKGDKVIFDYRLAFTPQTDDAKRSWQNQTAQVAGSYAGVGIVMGEFYVY